MYAIEFEDVTKKYGRQLALDNMNLGVKEGELFGFIGPNGAGKSTAIRVLLNYTFPKSGTARIMGIDCVRDSDLVKEMTTSVSSDVRLYENMKVADVFKLIGKFHRIDDIKERSEIYYDMFELDPKKKMRELSFGNKRKVAIVTALLPESRVIVLDEPTNGLDPLIQHRLFELLKERNRLGTTVFLSSHDLHEVQANCTSAAFIKDGKIVTTEDIKNEEMKKVIVLYGTNIDLTQFTSLNCEIIESQEDKVKLFCNGDIQAVLPVLKNENIRDFEIRQLELEDKFIQLYERAGVQS